MSNERAAFQAEVARVEQWWKVRLLFYVGLWHACSLRVVQDPRFNRVKRPYTAAQVVAHRGTLPIQYPSDAMGKKLWALLEKHARAGTVSHTYGACVLQPCSLPPLIRDQPRPGAGHTDGEVPRDGVRLGLAVQFDGVLDE